MTFFGIVELNWAKAIIWEKLEEGEGVATEKKATCFACNLIHSRGFAQCIINNYPGALKMSGALSKTETSPISST